MASGPYILRCCTICCGPRGNIAEHDAQLVVISWDKRVPRVTNVTGCISHPSWCICRRAATGARRSLRGRATDFKISLRATTQCKQGASGLRGVSSSAPSTSRCARKRSPHTPSLLDCPQGRERQGDRTVTATLGLCVQLSFRFWSMSSHSHKKQSQGWHSFQYHFRRTSDLSLYLSSSGRNFAMSMEMSPSNSTSQS